MPIKSSDVDGDRVIRLEFHEFSAPELANRSSFFCLRCSCLNFFSPWKSPHPFVPHPCACVLAWPMALWVAIHTYLDLHATFAKMAAFLELSRSHLNAFADDDDDDDEALFYLSSSPYLSISLLEDCTYIAHMYACGAHVTVTKNVPFQNTLPIFLVYFVSSSSSFSSVYVMAIF